MKTFLLLLLVVGLCACNKKRPFSSTTPAVDEPPTRVAGVRDFTRLVQQLSSALNVTTASIVPMLGTRYGVPTPPAGTTGPETHRLTMEFITALNYQSTNVQRSLALEANRMRLVGSFCEQAVTNAKALAANDIRRGIFMNISLTTVFRPDVETFLTAAALLFRRDGTMPAEDRDLIFAGMNDVAASAGSGGTDAAWIAGCIFVAGDSEAGEL